MRLTESAFRKLLKEAIRETLNAMNNEDAFQEFFTTVENGVAEIEFGKLQKGEAEFEINTEDGVISGCGTIDFDAHIDYGDKGDYWTPPTGDELLTDEVSISKFFFRNNEDDSYTDIEVSQIPMNCQNYILDNFNNWFDYNKDRLYYSDYERDDDGFDEIANDDKRHGL